MPTQAATVEQCSVQCTVYSVQFTVYSVHCTVYTVGCTVYITVYTVYCTAYTVQCGVRPRAAVAAQSWARLRAADTMQGVFIVQVGGVFIVKVGASL